MLERARAVRLAIFDVDGVMTDGTLYIGAQGEAFKAFNILDGHGMKMLQAAGVATAIISGRASEAVARRAAELGDRARGAGLGGQGRRLRARCIAKARLAAEACAFVGDDLPDLAVMRRCGLAVAVAERGRAVKQRARTT